MTELVLAIAIDELVTFAIAEAGLGQNGRKIAIEEIKLRGDRIDAVKRAITTFIKKHWATLERTSAIVVSSIGLVDSDSRVVRSIARPGWESWHENTRLDFRRLLTQSGHPKLIALVQTPSLGPKCRFMLWNDATVGAVGEFNASKQSAHPFVYIRVGEGVNAGFLLNGMPWRGGLHPELGHLLPRLHPKDHARLSRGKAWQGSCRIHGSCVEGLACKAALRSRWGEDAGERIHSIPGATELVAFYIAQLCEVATLLLAPPFIVLGGSLIDKRLCDSIHAEFLKLVRKYPAYEQLRRKNFIRLSYLEKRANIGGAIDLAFSAARGHEFQTRALRAVPH